MLNSSTCEVFWSEKVLKGPQFCHRAQMLFLRTGSEVSSDLKRRSRAQKGLDFLGFAGSKFLQTWILVSARRARSGVPTEICKGSLLGGL